MSEHTTTESHEIRVTWPEATAYLADERSLRILAADFGGKVAARYGGHPGRPAVTFVVAFGQAENASYEFEEAVRGEWYTVRTEQRLGRAAHDRNGAVVVVGDRIRYVDLGTGEDVEREVVETGREEPWLYRGGWIGVALDDEGRMDMVNYADAEVVR